MNDAGHKTAMNLAKLSEYVGLIFCVLGVVSGINHMLTSLSGGVLWYCTY